MQGIDAKVSTSRCGFDVWHRVRIGPITKLMISTAAQAAPGADVDALVIRVGD